MEQGVEERAASEGAKTVINFFLAILSLFSVLELSGISHGRSGLFYAG